MSEDTVPVDPAADPAVAVDPAPPVDPPGDPTPAVDLDADPTPPRAPKPTGPIQYKGEDLEPARGPGLGCFRFQLIVLAVFIVLTPLSVVWAWPSWISAALLFAVILLLLFTGQTIIFLLRLVAADRRTRRRPLGSATPTVGELEDRESAAASHDRDTAAEPAGGAAARTDASNAGADPAAPSDPAEPPDTATPRDDG